MNVTTCNLESCVTVKENDNVLSISRLLKDAKIRHVFVVNQNKFPLGIISVTDVNNRCVAEEKNPESCVAKDIMTSPIEVVDDCDAIEKAYQIMIEKNIFSIPVVKDEKLIGLLNFNEVMEKLAEKLKTTNKGNR